MTKKKGLQRRISNNSMMKSNDRKSDLKAKKVYNSSMESIFRKYVFISWNSGNGHSWREWL